MEKGRVGGLVEGTENALLFRSCPSLLFVLLMLFRFHDCDALRLIVKHTHLAASFVSAVSVGELVTPAPFRSTFLILSG